MDEFNDLLREVDERFPTTDEYDNNEDVEEEDDVIETNDDIEADDDYQENVGDEDEDVTESTTDDTNGYSPNVFSSIANVLKDEGALQNISDEDIQGLEDIDGFVDFLKNKINDSVDDTTKTIRAAITAGVPKEQVSTIIANKQYLNSLTEEILKNEEDENAANRRKELIIADLMNRGYSEERAERQYDKSYKSGYEVEDALEAWESLKEYYDEAEKDLRKSAEEYNNQILKERIKAEESFKNMILSDEKIFGGLEVSKRQRQDIYNALSERKNKRHGQKFTDVEIWSNENPEQYAAIMGLVYVLTNGGKDISGLSKYGAKKEIKKARKDLENALRSTSVLSDGKLRLVNSYNSKNDKSSKYSTFDIEL